MTLVEQLEIVDHCVRKILKPYQIYGSLIAYHICYHLKIGFLLVAF